MAAFYCIYCLQPYIWSMALAVICAHSFAKLFCDLIDRSYTLMIKNILFSCKNMKFIILTILSVQFSIFAYVQVMCSTSLY